MILRSLVTLGVVIVSRTCSLVAFVFLFLSGPLFSQQITINEFPIDRQVYPRNVGTNNGTVVVSGTVDEAGIDQMRLKVLRNGVAITGSPFDVPISFSGSPVPFSFSQDIPAELANYTFELYKVNGGTETLERTIGEVVAGDLYIVQGQSNAIAESYSGSAAAEESPFIRSFGTSSFVPADVTSNVSWYEADADMAHTSGAIGQWATRMARKILDNHSIPVGILNGAHGDKQVFFFHRDNGNPDDENTNYGRMLYRTDTASITDKIRAIFWFQGESDSRNPEGHEQGFDDLYSDWKTDYTGLEKIFVFQVREGCGSPNVDLRDRQRRLADRYSDVEVMASNGLDGHIDSDCHFAFADGYRELGDWMYGRVNEELYGGAAADNVEAPNIAYAYFSNPANTEITIVLRDPNDVITWDAGAEADFTLEGSGVTVTGGSISGNTIILTLSGDASGADGISYEGHGGSNPNDWIVNANGIGLLTFYNIPISPNATNALPIARFRPSQFSGKLGFVLNLDASSFSEDYDGSITSYSWNFDDGSPAGSGGTTTHIFASTGRYDVQLTVTDDDGGTHTTTHTIWVNSASACATGCFEESSGTVVVEAENFNGQVAGTGSAASHDWQTFAEGGASGGTGVQTDLNTGVSTGSTLISPRLDYDVNFYTAGTYYVWVRARAASGADNNFHAGFEGICFTNTGGFGMQVPSSDNNWYWVDDINSGQRDVTIEVPSAGKYTFSLWFRKDGIEFDKIVFSTSATVPTGNGPTESTSGAVCAGTLPVTLIDFNGTSLSDGSVQLNWSTSTEINSHYFQLERRAGTQTTFQSITQVSAAGQSQETRNYQYLDRETGANKRYYRLKMVDIDGSFTYSHIIEIDLTETAIPIKIFPNPTKEKVWIDIQGSSSLPYLSILTDLQGRSLGEYRLEAGTPYALNIDHLVPGTYLVSVFNATYQRVHTELIQKQ